MIEPGDLPPNHCAICGAWISDDFAEFHEAAHKAELSRQKTYEEMAVFIANIVYGFQGADPKIQKMRVGVAHAGEIIADLIEGARADERKMALIRRKYGICDSNDTE